MFPLDSSPTSNGKHWHCARLSDSHALERSCYKKSNYEAANVKTALSFSRPIMQWSPRRLIQNTFVSILETTSTNEGFNQTIAEKSRPVRVKNYLSLPSPLLLLQLPGSSLYLPKLHKVHTLSTRLQDKRRVQKAIKAHCSTNLLAFYHDVGKTGR